MTVHVDYFAFGFHFKALKQLLYFNIETCFLHNAAFHVLFYGVIFVQFVSFNFISQYVYYLDSILSFIYVFCLSIK